MRINQEKWEHLTEQHNEENNFPDLGKIRRKQRET
jgi:hypothetical protein